MDDEQRAVFARNLQKEEKQLSEQLRFFDGGLGQSLQDSVSELSSYDNHPADLASETFERSKDFALRQSAQNRLEAIHEAQYRLERGNYGVCERCGRPIDRERLLALPETTLCLECRRLTEAGSGHRNRPVEEDVLDPGSIYDPPEEAVDNNSFNREDSWQAVARYGTSETVSDVPESSRYPNIYVNREEDRGSLEDVDAIPYYRDGQGTLFKDYRGRKT